MGLFMSMSGMVTIELTSADIAGFLTSLNSRSIPVFQITPKDYLTVLFRVYRKDYPGLRTLAKQRGARQRIVRRHGIYWAAKSLLKRPVLLAGLLILFCMSAYLPARVFFVQVDGNTVIPAKQIIQEAEACGIFFGASRRSVRSEQVKNNLLAAIPELQWAGVNTRGCVATISVRERTTTEPQQKEPGVSSIVAARDGVIRSCTVTRGNALCKAGQAVKAGEVLVSGYTDCGIRIQATRAEAEIFAQTRHELTVITPVSFTKKGDPARVEKKYSLIIGKKRINFYKDSGISDTTCDKMYTEHILSLPGGFRLPVTLVEEKCVYYDNSTAVVVTDAASASMEHFAEIYLNSQMISGQILTRVQTVEQNEDIYCMYGQYTCLEMIGRVKSEEIIGSNGKND